MTFLAVLLAIGLQQVLSPGNPLQSRRWLLACDDALGRFLIGATPRLLVLLLAVLLVVRAVLEILDSWSFALPALLAETALLLWSLGSEDYHTVLERLAARQAGAAAGEDGESRAIAATLWCPCPDDDASARQRLLYAGYARWFPPLLYFVLAGPLAALAYRALAVLAARETDATRLRLLWLLDWLPARLLVLTFALAGDFTSVTRRLRELDAFGAATLDLLEVGALGACTSTADPRALANLLFRSAGLWLLALSAVILLF